MTQSRSRVSAGILHALKIDQNQEGSTYMTWPQLQRVRLSLLSRTDRRMVDEIIGRETVFKTLNPPEQVGATWLGFAGGGANTAHCQLVPR